MSEIGSADQGASQNWTRRIVWGFLLLVALYPLSLGPVVLIYDAGLLPTNVSFFLQIVYQPLENLHHTSPMFERVMDAYLRLWGRE